MNWKTLEKTRAKFQLTKDVRIGAAVLGAEFALSGRVQPQDLDYTAPLLRQIFCPFEKLDARGLDRAISRKRWKSYGWLPADRRHRAVVRDFRWRAQAADGYSRFGAFGVTPWLVGMIVKRLAFRLRNAVGAARNQ